MTRTEMKTRMAGSPATSSRWYATTVLLPSAARTRASRATASSRASEPRGPKDAGFKDDEVAPHPGRELVGDHRGHRHRRMRRAQGVAQLRVGLG